MTSAPAIEAPLPHDRLALACQAVAATPSEAAWWTSELYGLCPAPASSCSNLAASGDPVEFQLNWSGPTDRPRIRATVDPRPEGSALERLEQCMIAVAGLDDRQRALRDWLIDVSAAEGWRFGGWLGVRAGGGTAQRKLYVEVPESAVSCGWPAIDSLTRQSLPVRALTPMLAGFDPSNGRIEIYCTVAPLSVDALPLLLDTFRLPPCARQLIELLTELLQQRIWPRLPAEEQGISVAFGPDETPAALTWYAHCDALLGPPQKARDAILALGRIKRWDMRAYEALTVPDEVGRLPWHGVIGLGVDCRAGTSLAVTCSTRSGECAC